MSSRNVSDRVEMSTTGIVVVVTVVLVVVLVVVVVVLPAPGKLAGSAGLVPWSSSVRSKNPSRSRSTPMRMPEPGGTQVYTCSCPVAAARFRSAVFEITASELRSGWKLLLPT